MLINGVLSVYLCLYVMRVSGWDLLVGLGFAEVAFFTVIVALVMSCTVSADLFISADACLCAAW